MAPVTRWKIGRPEPGSARTGWFGAMVVALAGLLCLHPALDPGLAEYSYDYGFWLRPDRPVHEVAVAYMDDESHRNLAQPKDSEWDRSLHARLIQRLHQLGARAVVFDVLFSRPGDPEQDDALVSAARRFGPVAVAAVVRPVGANGELLGWETLRAFPALVAATQSGVVTQADGDRAVRRHFFNPNVTNLPSLGEVAARLAGGRAGQPDAERWLNFYGPPGYLPHFSYHEVFAADDGGQAALLVSNRVVFVGAALAPLGFTGGKMRDEFRTPYSRWSNDLSPGVEINATAFLNSLRGDALRRLPPAMEALLVFLFGVATALGLLRLRPTTGILAAGAVVAVVAGVSLAAAGTGPFWFPWAIPVLAQVPVALVLAMVQQSRRMLREKRAFEQALALASQGQPPSCPTAAGIGNAPAGATPAPAPGVPDFLRAPVPAENRARLPAVPDHELIQCIGRGGYGEVWLGRDILGSYHAIKILRLAAFASADPLATEFEGLRRFTPISRSHPGLVHVLHVGRDGGEAEPSRACLFYVMELADPVRPGKIDPAAYEPRTLARDLADRRRVPLAELLPVGAAVADALEHLHRNHLVHRDVKPANVVFVKGQAKLADVGLVADAVGRDSSGLAFLGTPDRIAPEGTGSPAADVFSLGKLLYEAGFGLPVDRFPELPPDMIAAGADPHLYEFNRMVMKACDPDPRRRFQTAAELRDALRALHRRLGPEGQPARAGEPIREV